MHCTHVPALTLLALVSHQGVAPLQPISPVAPWLLSEQVHLRQPVVTLVVHIGKSALVVMQAEVLLSHIVCTFHVPCAPVIDPSMYAMSPTSPHVVSYQAIGCPRSP